MTPTVVLPTREERDNIGPLLRVLTANLSPAFSDYELLVVDGDSPDGTVDAARAAAAGDPRIRVETLPGGRGLAAAVRHGLERGRGDCFVVMNTDFQHDPDLVPRLLDRLRTHELVIGSRFVPGGGMKNGVRFLLSRAYSRFLAVLLGGAVRDRTCGFLAVRAEALRRLNPDRIFRGYGEWFFRLLFDADRDGWRILEIPACYGARRSGRSKSRLASLLVAYTVAAIRLAGEPGRDARAQRAPSIR